MLKPEFLILIQRLCINFDHKSLSREKADLWFEKTRDFTESQLRRAVEMIIEQQERFPSLAIMLTVISRIRGLDAINQENADLERMKEDFFEHPPDPEYIQESMDLVRSAGYRSPEDYHAAMLEMNRKWPGRGWLEEAQECLQRRKRQPKKASTESVGEILNGMDDLPF